MKVVVTGATGLLGNNLVRLLVENGHEVRCTRRESSDIGVLEDCPVEWVYAQLSDAGSLSEAFTGAEVVFHCAAQVGTARKVNSKLIAANVTGTENVLRALEGQRSARLVYTSTIATCAVSENGCPVTEEQDWNYPRFGLDGGYTITKKQAEDLVLAAVNNGLDAVIVNPTFMLGPHDNRLSSNKLILDIVNGAIPGYTGGINNFVDVRDVAAGMLLAAEKGKTGQRYILGGQNLSYREIMGRIAGIAGVSPVARRLPRALATVFGKIGDIQELFTGREALLNSVGMRWAYCNCSYSSEKAHRELGYQWRDIDVAIRDAIDWFRQAGILQAAS